jgi:transposase InsO family protein
MVELVRAGRSPAQLSREFGVTAQSITNWVGQAAIDEGKPVPGKEGLSTAEREELVPIWMGFLYLAVVINVWSRRVVGLAMGERMTADLVLATLNMALEQRKAKGVIHHSDQGSQGGFNRSSQHL